ncbi:hypothetical protein JCM30760_10230 [Thiomicrorhabdus hydrogeniphila]
MPDSADLEQIISVVKLMPNPVVVNRVSSHEESSDLNDEIVYVNPAFIKTIGYTVDDIPNDRVWCEKAYPKESYRKYVIQTWLDSMESACEHKKDFTSLSLQIHCKDQTDRWFQVTAQPKKRVFGDFNLIVLVETDTPDEIIQTLQAKSEGLFLKNQDLRISEQLLAKTQRIAKIGSWEIYLQDGSLKLSEQMYHILGEDPATYQPSMESFYSKISEEGQHLAQSMINEAIQTGERGTIKNKFSVTKNDNSIVYLEVYAQAIYDEKGTPIKVVGSALDVTNRVNLQNQSNELADLIRVAHQELYIVDFETDQYLYANESASLNTGYSNEEIMEFTVFDLNPQLTEEMVQAYKASGDKVNRMSTLSVHNRKDGSTYPVHATIQRVTYNGIMCYAIFDADISELHAAQEASKVQLNLLQKIVDTVPVRIFWKDVESRFLGANKLFLEDASLDSVEELIGKTDYDLMWSTNDAEAYQKEDMAVVSSGQPLLKFEETQVRKNGEVVTLLTSKVPLEDANGEIFGVLGTYEDITQLRKNEQLLISQRERLHFQAYHDALTGLPNRAMLEYRLEHAIQQTKRHRQKFALLFLDLDQFKQINDSMGHEVGDCVLKEVAKNLHSSIRESDTLARIGGDEFTIIMNEVDHLNDISILAKKIIDISKQPVFVKEQVFYLSSSLGISVYPKDGETPDALLKCADAAMYKAKELGRDNFQFYTRDMTLAAFEHIAMQASLRKAISNNEFVVHYQPQINAKTNKIIGMEALVRWLHPALGLVVPNTFIPLAEETGLIVELDRLVMKMAMQQWQQWHQQGMNLGLLSINLAAKQLQKPDFINYLKECLNLSQFKAEWLVLELTESDIMKNLEVINSLLLELGGLGVKIAIDDFGTGYSSLAYLKRLPVTKLKIDRSFIKDLPLDEEDCIITKTIITMAGSLGLEVLAEGVETSEQRDFLQQNGCNYIQGYFFSKPIPSEDVPLLVKRWL